MPVARRNNVQPISDDALIAAAAAGDREAFATFYRRWLPVVVGYHLRRTADHELAFDLTAETFAAAVASCAAFDPARGPAAGWLFGIAQHKLTDSFRHRRVEVSARKRLGLERIAVDDDDLLRVEELASSADGAMLMDLLADLPEDQQAAIRARIVDDVTYQDIATTLGCSEAVVRQRVHRGLRQLREKVKERKDERVQAT